jgi:hypothetical protein
MLDIGTGGGGPGIGGGPGGIMIPIVNVTVFKYTLFADADKPTIEPTLLEAGSLFDGV